MSRARRSRPPARGAEPTAAAEPVLVSAHRGGAGRDRERENTLEALRDATRIPCEYVEFDVQRCADGVYVVYHDRRVRRGDRRVRLASLTFPQFVALADSYLLLDDALDVLRGRRKVHLDLKLVYDEHGGAVPAGHEVAVVRHVVDVMGAENVVVTGLSDASVRAVRAWARARCPDLLVGLSLSRDAGVRGLKKFLAGHLDDVLPGRRLRASDANLAVCERKQARLWGARWARRRGLPLLVWTVDDGAELRAWLRDGHAWMVTTNFPRRAVELRAEVGPAPVPGA